MWHFMTALKYAKLVGYKTGGLQRYLNVANMNIHGMFEIAC